MKTTKTWSILALSLGLLVCSTKLNAQDRIYEGDSEVEVIDTGDGYIQFVEDNLERMRLSNGRLGIGTTTPAERIHVYGGNLMVENHETTVSFRGNCYSNLNRSAAVYFYRSRGTKIAPLALETNDAMGFFGFVGYDGTAYSSSEAYFKASADGPWSATSHPTHMLFATCEAGSTVAEPRLFVDDTGYVGIGTTSPGTYKLAVNGSAAKPGGGSWSDFSDGRLKRLGGSYARGLSDVTQLNPVRYSYKEDNALELPTGEEHVGLVAQDVQAAIPEAVEENRDGYLMVNNDPIIWAMVNAIKELKAENDFLRQDNDSLRQGFRTLTQRLEALERTMGQHKLASSQAAGSYNID